MPDSLVLVLVLRLRGAEVFLTPPVVVVPVLRFLVPVRFWPGAVEMALKMRGLLLPVVPRVWAIVIYLSFVLGERIGWIWSWFEFGLLEADLTLARERVDARIGAS